MKKLLLLVILLVSTAGTFGKNLEFKSLETVGDEPLRSIVELKDGSLLLAADHGLFKSTDKGKHWDLLHFAQRDTTIYKLNVLKNGSIIALTDSGYIRSDDNAQSWIDLRIGLNSRLKNYFYNKKRDILYSILDSNIYFSSDNGDKWEILLSKEILPKSIYNFIETDNGDFFCLSIDENYSNNILRSKDKGKNWIKMKYKRDGYDDEITELFYLGGDTIYGSHYQTYEFNTIYYINIQLDTVNANNNNNYPAIYSMAKDSMGNLYIGTREGLYRYNPQTNDVDSLFQLIINIGEYWDEYVSSINDIFINSDNKIYIAHVTGVYQSTDSGNNWEKIFSSSENMNRPIRYGSGLIELQDGELLLTYNRNFYKTEYNRRYWKLIETGLKGRRTRGFSVTHFTSDNKGKVYAFYDSLGLFISINNGNNWTRIDSTTFSFIYVFNSYVDKFNNMFIGTYNGLFETTDEGYTWNKHHFFDNKIINSITGFSIDTVIVAIKNELYITYNHGGQWNLLKKFDTNNVINTIRINSKGEIFVCAGFFIYRYSNNKWEQITKGFEGGEIKELLVTKDDELIALTTDGIYFSNLNGNLWEYESDINFDEHYWYGLTLIILTNDGKAFVKYHTSFVYSDILKQPIDKPEWIDKGDYLEQKKQINYIDFIKYSMDGKVIFTDDGYTHFYKWDVITGDIIFDFYHPYYYFKDFSMNKNSIVLMDNWYFKYTKPELYVYLYNLDSDSIVKTININISMDTLFSISNLFTFLVSDNKLITSFNSVSLNQLAIWDLNTGDNIKYINLPYKFIVKKIGPDLLILKKVTRDNNYTNTDTLHILITDFSLSEIKEIYTEPFKKGSYEPEITEFDAVKNGDKNSLILSVNNNELIEIDLNTFEQIGTIPTRALCSKSRPLSLFFSDDYKYLTCNVKDINDEYYIKFFNLETRRVDYTYHFSEAVVNMALSPNSKDIAEGGSNGYLRILKPRILNLDFHANFTSDSNFVIKNEPLQFYDISNGNPIWRVWDFGDGTASDEKNPVHTYRKSGEYTVKLTAYDGFKIDSVIKENYVVVKEPLWVNFTASPKIGYFPLDVQFYDKSYGGLYYNINWDFGDGWYDEEKNPIHRFWEPGIYQVTLRIDDNYFFISKSDTIIVLDTVTIIDDDNKNFSVSVFPNPANDFVIVNYKDEQPTLVNITLSDILGNEVYLKREYLDSGYHTQKLDVGSLESGIYFLKVSANDVNKTFKVAIMK